MSNCVAIKGIAEIKAVTTEDLQQTDSFLKEKFRSHRKLKSLECLYKTPRYAALLATCWENGLFFITRDTGKKCFDNDIKSCFTATEVSLEKKTKMPTCMV